MARDVVGDPGTWETARALGKQLNFPVGPYEARVPTAEEMNAVLPYILDRATRHYEREYYCENAEVALAHLLGVNVPRQGFPRSDGFSRHNLDWNGFSRDGFDREGFNREGFNRNGYDRSGFDKDGYNRDGYDRDGFNRKGVDWYGKTREKLVAELVEGWSDEMAAAVAAHMIQQGVELVAPEPPKKAVKKAAKKAVAPKKAPPRKITRVANGKLVAVG